MLQNLIFWSEYMLQSHFVTWKMNHFLEIHLVLEFNFASGFMRFKEIVGI